MSDLQTYYRDAARDIRRLQAAVEFITESRQARANERAEAYDDAVERAAADLSFDDVLAQLAELPAQTKAALMRAQTDDPSYFAWQLATLFGDAIEAAARDAADREIARASRDVAAEMEV